MSKIQNIENLFVTAIICVKFHNNLAKDEKVMVKCFDFGQELREM